MSNGSNKAKKQPCSACGKQADPVHRVGVDRATEKSLAPTRPHVVLRGWFCPYCGNFDKSIGREGGLGLDAKTE